MNIKKVLTAVFLYVSAIIGAGFAAGRELNVYFFDRGLLCGILGLLAASMLFGLTAYKVLVLSESGIKSYRELLIYLFDNGFGKFFHIIGVLFFVVLLASMTAAFGEICQNIGFDSLLARVIFCALCFFALCFELKGLTLVSNILCPLMLCGCIAVGVYSINKVDTSLFIPDIRVFLSSVIYVSYNILTGAAVLFLGQKYNKKEAAAVGIAVFAVILATGTLAGTAALRHSGPLPIYESVKNNKTLLAVYSAVLLFAIFTTALSSAFCLRPYAKSGVICLAGFFLSLAGFSNIVEKFYFLFGIAGSGVLFAVLFCPIYKNKDS